MQSSFSTSSRASGTTHIVHETLLLKESLKRSKKHLLCGCINSIVVGIVVFDLFQRIWDKSFSESIFFKFEVLVATVLGINTVFHFVKYAITSFSLPEITLSPYQHKLIGVHLPDKYVRPIKKELDGVGSVTSNEPVFTATSPMNLSSNSWLSPQALSETECSNNRSQNLSTSFSPNSYFSASPIQDDGLGTFIRPLRNSGDDIIIRDENSLRRFLEQSKTLADYQDLFDQSGGSDGRSVDVVASFCDTSQSPVSAQVSPLFRKTVYQTASAAPVAGCSSPGAGEEGASPLIGASSAEQWRRLNIDPAKLTQWNANLRMWLSLTILQRLVKELELIDSALLRCGLSDLRVGSVGLDRLKKTACFPQVVASIPSLPRLVSFLELSPHQEYLVTRIRELAKGGSMSEFRWSSGGSLNGKSWEEHLPTDAALIMHLVATYLDLQVLPSPHRPDNRPFSSQHLVRSPEKPSSTTTTAPVIYQQQLNPPHFMLVDKNEVLDIPKGRNNLFYCLLVFLHILKTREHGMLGPVNLGRSGLNILWVLDS